MLYLSSIRAIHAIPLIIENIVFIFFDNEGSLLYTAIAFIFFGQLAVIPISLLPTKQIKLEGSDLAFIEI